MGRSFNGKSFRSILSLLTSTQCRKATNYTKKNKRKLSFKGKKCTDGGTSKEDNCNEGIFDNVGNSRRGRLSQQVNCSSSQLTWTTQESRASFSTSTSCDLPSIHHSSPSLRLDMGEARRREEGLEHGTRHWSSSSSITTATDNSPWSCRKFICWIVLLSLITTQVWFLEMIPFVILFHFLQTIVVKWVLHMKSFAAIRRKKKSIFYCVYSFIRPWQESKNTTEAAKNARLRALGLACTYGEKSFRRTIHRQRSSAKNIMLHGQRY